MTQRHLDHAAGDPCAICDAETSNRATDDEMEALYVALDCVNLRPGDVIPQIRAEGRKIRSLSELTSWEARKLTRECRKWQEQKGAVR